MDIEQKESEQTSSSKKSTADIQAALEDSKHSSESCRWSRRNNRCLRTLNTSMRKIHAGTMRKRTDTCKVCKHWDTWGSKQVAKKALEIRDALENCMEDYFKHFVAVAEMQGWMKEGFEKQEMWEAPNMK